MLDSVTKKERKRASRFGRTDADKIIALTDRQLELLRLHDPLEASYRYLNPALYAGLLGCSEQFVRDWLIYNLNGEKNRFIRLVDDFDGQMNGYLFWEIDQYGLNAIERPGIKLLKHGQQLPHRVGIDTVKAGMEVGARAHNVRRMSPRDIYNRDRFKKKDEEPFALPVHIERTVDGKPIRYPKIRHPRDPNYDADPKFNYTPDDINGWLYPDGSALFTMLEMELTTRGDTHSDFNAASFLKKYLAFEYILDNKLYAKYWGIGEPLLLIVAQNRDRIETRMDIVKRETGGEGHPNILFKVIPSLVNKKDRITCHPEYFGPWERVGYPDFDFSNPPK
jgi:hypothetical protein